MTVQSFPRKSAANFDGDCNFTSSENSDQRHFSTYRDSLNCPHHNASVALRSFALLELMRSLYPETSCCPKTSPAVGLPPPTSISAFLDSNRSVQQTQSVTARKSCRFLSRRWLEYVVALKPAYREYFAFISRDHA